MPKLKTKSGAKKRFKLTASGKVTRAQAGKRHGMIKRTPKQIRNKRGTTVLSDSDSRIVKKLLTYAEGEIDGQSKRWTSKPCKA